jgi:hypothetical protein
MALANVGLRQRPVVLQLEPVAALTQDNPLGAHLFLQERHHLSGHGNCHELTAIVRQALAC